LPLSIAPSIASKIISHSSCASSILSFFEHPSVPMKGYLHLFPRSFEVLGHKVVTPVQLLISSEKDALYFWEISNLK
jgi:hypothetical protein